MPKTVTKYQRFTTQVNHTFKKGLKADTLGLLRRLSSFSMSILIFLLVLSGLVLIHEAGHYLAARWAGVKPEEFGVGFPPRALGWTKEGGKWRRVKKGELTATNTIWSLNWLPLGGFVRLKGEQGEAASDRDSFAQARLGKKFVIIAAGVFMNWLLATLIFTGGYLVGVPVDGTEIPPEAIVTQRYVEITQILPGSPAERVGLQVGDRVQAIDGRAAERAEQIRDRIRGAAEAQPDVVLTIDREGEVKEIRAVPEILSGAQTKGIGIGLADTAVVRWAWWRAPLEGAKTTWFYTIRIVQGLGGLVRDLVVKRQVDQSVSGPVGIAVMTGRIADQGVWPLLQFAAILSVNLAVVNFLPIPGLDGGRALFLLAEFARRKRLNANLEAAIHGFGFIFLLILILLVTIQDLFRFGPGIWQGIRGIF